MKINKHHYVLVKRHFEITRILYTNQYFHLLFLSFLFLSNACTNHQVFVQELKCEYLTDPLGIDVLSPRLSWKLTSASNGERQTAYQILAATKPELLNENKADLWNSGKTQSGQSIHIKYAGKELKAGMQVYWKVKAWGANGHTSDWSETAKWEMGLMQSDWQAIWIGAPIPDLKRPGNMNPAYYFRKNISLPKKIKKARAYISGLGYYELYINGEKVGDHVLSPNHTNYDHRNPGSFEEKRVNNMSTRILYETYNITPYLREGENTLAVCLGNGWYFQNNRDEDLGYNYGTPRFISRFEVELADGSEKMIFSDESWKTSMGPILHNGVYSGEIYDARVEQKGWNTTGFNDHDWNAALLVRPPDGKLQAQLSPPDRVIKVIRPISVTNTKKNLYLFDLGEMISGWARIRVKGPRGTKIKLSFIEEMGPVYGQTDTYILNGEGIEVWEPRFTWHAFRKVAVTSPIPLTLESLEGVIVNTDVPRAGTFQCSNTLFNTINENFIRTQAGNMHGGIPSDCPHRERRGYTGDGQIAARAAIYNFNMASFYTKWMNDISDAQNQETGYIPNTVPYQGGGGGTPWGSAYVIVSWYMYLYYGDIQILEQHYSGMKKWIDYLKQQTDTDGLIKENNLGEWVPPEETEIPPSFVSTAYYYHNLELMFEIAEALGKSSDSSYFISLAEKTKKAFNNKYFHEENKSYSIGRQGANVFPLGFEMVPEEIEQEVFNTLVKHIVEDLEGHFDTGMMGTPLLLEVLANYGRPDLAYTLMSQWDFPGFGFQINKGATTIWETWNGDASHSHPMFGSVCQWLYNSLVGINPDPEQPGFKHIIIKPQAVSNLKNAKANYESCYG
ncbi:MAG: family 78 glycoside hydrolase catalytic domain, partial [Bacteroidales bacterium]|nr:family 78 glycoside hydrolase catalytic domain [Bacteroidales bacterium]